MRKIIIATVLTASMIMNLYSIGLVSAQEQETYHNAEGHFSFILPDDWIKIPDKIMKETYEAMLKSTNQPMREISYIGFQRESDYYFTYPYMAIRVNKTGRLVESEWKEYLESTEAEIAADKFIEEKNKQPASLLNIIEQGKPIYDSSKHVLYLTGEAELKGVGKVTMLSVNILSNYGSVDLYFNARKDSFNEDLHYFKQIINSFEFDKGYEY